MVYDRALIYLWNGSDWAKWILVRKTLPPWQMVLGLHFLHLSTKKERIYIPKIDKEMGKCTAWCWLSANCNISHYCPGFPLWLRYLAIMRLLMYDCWPMTPIIPGDKSQRPHNHPDSQRIKTWGQLLDHNKCQDLCSFPIFGGILTRKASAETKAEQ